MCVHPTYKNYKRDVLFVQDMLCDACSQVSHVSIYAWFKSTMIKSLSVRDLILFGLVVLVLWRQTQAQCKHNFEKKSCRRGIAIDTVCSLCVYNIFHACVCVHL